MANLKTLDKLVAIAIKAERRVNKYRKLLAKNCKHERTANYTWEHDNGYGRQTKMTGKECMICYGKDLWNRGKFSNGYVGY